VPGEHVEEAKRKPPCGVEVVIEVDDIKEERDRVVEELLRLEKRGIEEDVVDRP
jgi:hypothetical protein